MTREAGSFQDNIRKTFIRFSLVPVAAIVTVALFLFVFSWNMFMVHFNKQENVAISQDVVRTINICNEMMSDVAFDDKILIIVKSTIDKSICTVNNVKELIEHLYTEFVDNAEAQALLPELIEHAQSYRGLSDEEFENVIHEMIEKINRCKHIEEAKNNKELYKGIDDNDPEALQLQIQLRDKLKKIRQKSEMN